MDTLHTAYSFTYDQLGQLRHARTLTGFSGTHWNATITKAFSTSYTYDPVGNIRTLKRYDKDGNLLDDLTYHYYDTLHNNKLSHITDAVTTSNFLLDLETQNPGNYSYDSVGNMISDASRTLTVQYTYSNRPKFINFANGRSLKMKYNPFGYRFFSGPGNSTGDVFIYSSQGQLVAKYKVSGNTLKLNYLPIYESSKRIGIVEPLGVSWEDCPELMPCGLIAIDPCMIGVIGQPIPTQPCKKDSSFKADRKYELVDHLGNVRVVIANQRIPVDTNGDSLVDYYKPLVKEISDYYPYGWVKFYGNYEFGANAGSLFEDWDSTSGTYYTLYRLLDARIARWYQVEPKIESYGTWSGYSYVFNNPVMSVDLLGLDSFWIGKNGKVEKHVSSGGPHVFIGPDGRNISVPADQLIDWKSNEKYTYFEFEDTTYGEQFLDLVGGETNVEWSFVQFKTGEMSVGTVYEPDNTIADWLFNYPDEPSELFKRMVYWERINKQSWYNNIKLVGHTHPHLFISIDKNKKLKGAKKLFGKKLVGPIEVYLFDLTPSQPDRVNADVWQEYGVKAVIRGYIPSKVRKHLNGHSSYFEVDISSVPNNSVVYVGIIIHIGLGKVEKIYRSIEK